MRIAATLLVLATTFALASGCSEDAPTDASATATTTAAATTTPKPATAASSAPTALVDRKDCPKGSSGPGTLEHPCEGKGNDRLMEAKWNNKIDDKGPFFNVKNKSGATVLWSRIAVYYYDKAGKQLTVKVEDKDKPYKLCSGNIPGGVMKPDENAKIQFPCVGKESVPANTALIEAEMIGVGFADAAGQKVEFYWLNKDLAPDVRPKGGAK
jgi:hypothetical protein